MKTVLHAVAVASLLALSACSTVDSKPGLSAANQSQNLASDDDHPITGTRLPIKRTERIVRATGQQDYRNAIDSQPRPLDSQ